MIKLQLDTKALESLFSTDELKVNLQQAVLEEFGRRHIKAFANTELAKQLNESVEKRIDQAIRDHKYEILSKFGDITVYGGFRLSDGMKKAITKNISTEFNKKVATCIDEEVEKRISTIDKYVEQAINDKINEEVDKRVKIKLAKIRDSI